MEATPSLDMDANHRQPSQYRVPTLADLISEAQGSQVVPSYTDKSTIATSHVCQSLSEMIKFPSDHHPLTEKDLEFPNDILPQPPPGRDDTDHASSQETDYSDPTSPPSFPIETNRALLQSTAAPAVGIPTVPSRNKFKFKDYDSDDDTHYGYDSDNQCGNFLDDVAGEEDYDYDKDIQDSMAWGV